MPIKVVDISEEVRDYLNNLTLLMASAFRTNDMAYLKKLSEELLHAVYFYARVSDPSLVTQFCASPDFEEQYKTVLERAVRVKALFAPPSATIH